MRSYARRNQDHRGKISIHAHDDAAHADRLPETRIEVHASRRPKIATGCYGFAPQACVRSARFSCVITFGFIPAVGSVVLSFRPEWRNLLLLSDPCRVSMTFGFTLSRIAIIQSFRDQNGWRTEGDHSLPRNI